MKKLTGYEGLGVQFSADFYGCKNISDDTRTLKNLMQSACKAMNATIISSHVHKFEPQGLSGIVIIAESHLAVHTWPELDFASIDIFTCGTMDYEAGLEILRESMKPKKITTALMRRGTGKSPKVLTNDIVSRDSKL